MNPRHQLREINDITHRLLTDWTRYSETIGAMATTGDKLGVHGGDIPDPTIAGVYANQNWTEACSQISEALGILKLVERAVNGVTREHPETVRDLDAAARAARCADPVCTDNAVKDGLCFTHWQARRTG